MKKKFLSILMIFTLIIFGITTSVSALSFTATMTPSSTTVAEATEFTVKVKVSNLDVGTNGINSLSGYLKYDTEVFDTISESNLEGLNDWKATYEASSGKISLSKATFVTSTQEVFQITFKTKSEVSGTSGTISYTNIVASNSETDISASDISTSITVGDGEGTESTNSTNTVSVITANTSTVSANTSSINTITSNTSNDDNNTNTVSSYVNTMTNTTSEDDMPKTGADDTALILIFCAVALAMVFYLKIQKLNDDMK